MAILANRIKIQNHALEISKFIIYVIDKLSDIILLAMSFYLLYFSMPQSVSNIISETVGQTLSTSTLCYKEAIKSFQWINSRLSYFRDLETTNLNLKLKIARLEQHMQIATNIQIENNELKKILNVISYIDKKFVTAKVISIAYTPFSSSATLQSGSKNGIKINDIVRGSLGLIGRISTVSDNYSNVLLVNDYNSRIPVITGTSKVKGIISRQYDNLKLMYVEEHSNILIGETLYTSGEGTIFPKGIPVAIIVKITNNTVIAEPIEKLNRIEYVVIESNL